MHIDFAGMWLAGGGKHKRYASSGQTLRIAGGPEGILAAIFKWKIKMKEDFQSVFPSLSQRWFVWASGAEI